MEPLEIKNNLIAIGIPVERTMMPAFVNNRDVIIAHLAQRGLMAEGGLIPASGHRVDHNRDSIIQVFLSLPQKPDWLLMLDSDMEHPVMCGEILVGRKLPIIGALYFHRGSSHEPFCFRRCNDRKDGYGRMGKLWAPMYDEVHDFIIQNHIPPTDGPIWVKECSTDPLLYCDAVATGCMMIHRSVLEKMPQPIFEYRPGGNSEDLVFCAEAKETGYPVVCDLSLISGHYLDVPISVGQFEAGYRHRGMAMSQYTPEAAATWYKDFYEISLEQAKTEIDKGTPHDAGDYWRECFGNRTAKPREVHEWYSNPETGKKYIMELLHWNYTNTFKSLQEQITPIWDQNVLEIGSGIGTVSIQLMFQRNNVLSIETNKLLQDFSKLREKTTRNLLTGYERLGSILYGDPSWETKVPDNSYEAVVSFEVFEHIPAEPLREMLKAIGRVLKRGGYLYFTVNFGQQDLYPMHFDHSKWFYDCLDEIGLFQISPGITVNTKKG